MLLVNKLLMCIRFIVEEFGGHFPGLDNPVALANDIRVIGKHWHK